ncbi:hypothetical protein LEP1GSC111_4571 [Leptospira interrogans str. UT126]|nr:hypothetical protein LEP1GSC111_4571 [Leptospira interrogans str. UT126]
MVNANLASNPRFSSPEGAPFCLNINFDIQKKLRFIQNVDVMDFFRF